MTGEDQWLERAEACYRGILKSNPKGKPHPDFGTEPFTIDQRFGLAGVTAFYQGMYAYTGQKEYLDSAADMIDHILSFSNNTTGLSWPMNRFGFMQNAGEKTTFTGFFYGSTGFGSLFLNQFNLSEHKTLVGRFVDNPFK
jgi:hypothetical protein